MWIHLIHGRPTVVIRKFKDHSHRCQNCGTYDLSVKVYRKYFHIFFIPIFAFGVKTAMIRCNKCTEPYRSDSLQKQYEEKTRTPFYLFSGPILFCLLVAGATTAHFINKKAEAGYIQHPMVGDVYQLRPSDAISYYFLKVIKVKDDSLVTCRNAVNYLFYVYKPDKTDSFTNEEMWISRKDIQNMYDKDIIQSVDRSNNNH